MNRLWFKRSMGCIRPQPGMEARIFAGIRSKQQGRRRAVLRWIAAGTCAAGAVAALWIWGGSFRRAQHPDDSEVLAVHPYTTSETPEQRAGAAPKPTETVAAADAAPSEPGPVDYGSLSLAQGETLEIPPNMGKASLCVALFEESMLSGADVVVKATVKDCRIRYAGQEAYAQYTLRVDALYFDDVGIGLDSELTLEEPLQTTTSLADLVMGLRTNRQYLLPLCLPAEEEGAQDETEEVYRLLYPYAPQIEVSQEGAYIFYRLQDPDGGWTSLDNSLARRLDMGDRLEQSEYGWLAESMRVRFDEGFEEDFQRLVDQYCVKDE